MPFFSISTLGTKEIRECNDQSSPFASTSNRLMIVSSVLGITFGDHVGDWEHTMVRFIDGVPSTVYFSEHTGGSAYEYSVVEKSGVRPVTYIGIGTHANYAVRLHLCQRSQSRLTVDYVYQDPGRSRLQLTIWPFERPDG